MTKTLRQHVEETGSLDGFYIGVVKESGLYINALGASEPYPGSAREFMPGNDLDNAKAEISVVLASKVLGLVWEVPQDGAPRFVLAGFELKSAGVSKNQAVREAFSDAQAAVRSDKSVIRTFDQQHKKSKKRLKQIEKLRATIEPKKKKKKGSKLSKKKPAKGRKKPPTRKPRK